jgi:antitoxin HicB
MLRYPVKLEPDDNGTVRVSFPDIPEAHTSGVDRDDALRRAEEALEAALSVYIARRLPIPTAPRPGTKAMPLVGLPTLSEAKVALYCAMRDAGVRNADLARRVGRSLRSTGPSIWITLLGWSSLRRPSGR